MDNTQLIYLDNAATSYPKPSECMHRALDRYLQLGASPSRGGYDLAREAEDAVSEVRHALRRFFGAGADYPVCFSSNATDALNTLIQGLTRPGDHVVSTCLEHNSVLRPLHHLRVQGRIEFDLAGFDTNGFVDPGDIAAMIRPQTRLVIINHASNVLGTVQPVAAIGEICRSAGIPLILDVSQSAGAIPIAMKSWHVSGLAFTGHKSLLGPCGIGGLIIHPDLPIRPTRFGGTGIDSANLFHTQTFPHRLEAGTLNLLGILALGESLSYLQTPETRECLIREMALTEKLREGLSEIDGIDLYAAQSLENHIPLITCNVRGHVAADVGAILDGDFNIAVRAGLHCAPLVHERLGTAPNGAIRFSPGIFNRKAHIHAAISAMSIISRSE
ncbi:MAG: aminotransferase class V-fold PLP-dependent enzyme [Deltaproteobacteria bacterium]|nr:aminotransferase class V-fold PLP-dependent enzyme [Deltaproteobacteria bacterium]